MTVLPEKPTKVRNVYMDNASGAPLEPRVFDVMKPYLLDSFGNPSSIHARGVTAKKAVDAARKKISKALHAQPDTIYFGSCGTEMNNLAILGTTREHQNHGKHIITTKIEHKSVLGPIKKLEQDGFEVTYLDVDNAGNISLADLQDVLRSDTILVSIMHANNEIGTILPIADIGRIILKHRKKCEGIYPYFHCDAASAAPHMQLDVEKLHVDLMTVVGSKIKGPWGAAFLYKRRGIEIEPLMYGGGQESNLRSGTHNVAGIVGLAEAFSLVEYETEHVREKRNLLCDKLVKALPDISISGPDLTENRLPNHLSIIIPNLDAQKFQLYLDEYGITLSTGSACTGNSIEESHVIKACGFNSIGATIRMTLDSSITDADIDYVVQYFVPLAKALEYMN